VALFTARNTIESYIIILFTIVLRTVANYTTEPIPNNTFTILCNIVILIILKVLNNIVATVKKLIVIEFTIH